MEEDELRLTMRNLVTNVFMPEFDYRGTRFSFLTVYYKTAYSYCCCTCAFEHEYVDYVTESGDINEPIYEKIVQSILNQKCPHVEGADDKHVNETSVYGIHLAAVVGTVMAVTNHLLAFNDNDKFGNIFGMDPYLLSVLKDTKITVDIFCELRNGHAPITTRLSVDFPTKVDESGNIFHSERLSIVDICHRKRNYAFLMASVYSGVYPLGIHVARFLSMTYKLPLDGYQELVHSYITKIFDSSILTSCCEWIPAAVVAIVYNEPDTLSLLLAHLKNDLKQTQDNVQIELGETCFVLNRDSCKNVLTSNGVDMPSSMSQPRKIRRLVNLLHSFYDDFKDEIKAALQTVWVTQETIKLASMKSIRHCRNKNRLVTLRLIKYLHSHYELIDSRVVETLLELGADVDHVDSTGLTPLLHLLKACGDWPRRCYYRNIRETVELLIYQNPDVTLNGKAVEVALNTDAHLMKGKCDAMSVYGMFTFDGKEHVLFCHNTTSSFALNFLAPLLIECGFPVARNTLIDANNKNLHAAEHEFLQQRLNCSILRSLQYECRNVLRKHFAGRALHRFVESSGLPDIIKDYILMRNLLKCYDKNSHLSKIPDILHKPFQF